MGKKFDKHLSKKNQHQKEEPIQVIGKVTESLGGDKFKIQLENGHELIGYISGDLRRHFIKILPDDYVKVELSPYDLKRGRMTYRYKSEKQAKAEEQKAG
jgi:translation initiation factor IF-1